jgi:AI-2 transport protein TqsA
MDADDESGEQPTATRSTTLRLLVGAAALTIILAGVRSLADIVAPVVLALVITVTVHPVRRWLDQTRLPGWLTSIVMLAAAYLLIVGVTLALAVSVAQLAAMLPMYTSELSARAADVGSTLKDLGVGQEQIDSMVKALDPGDLVDAIAALLSSTLSVLSDLVFIFTVLLFMTFDTSALRRNLALLHERFPNPVSAMAGFADTTRKYMVVSATFGFIVAVIDGVLLYLMDVPGAFAWAVLAFVTNFIPNIGFVIGLVPPALIALLDSGPGLMLAVIVMYCVVNFVIQSIIQPRVVGDAVGLSPTLTFLSLVFWTTIVGPLGALLAVPLSLLARAILVDADPRASWATPLISGKSAPPDQARPGP